MPKIVCPNCGEELDKVVLSFGTRTWDEKTQSYQHFEGEDEGDWGCPTCGATVSETRFYPPVASHSAPQTDDEWEDLGFDIEAKLPVSIGGLSLDRQIIRDAVATITGKRKEGNTEDAKRWLVQTAGKLRIGEQTIT